MCTKKVVILALVFIMAALPLAYVGAAPAGVKVSGFVAPKFSFPG